MSSSAQSINTQEQSGDNRFRLWFLLRANRWALVGLILLVLYGCLIAASQLGLTPVRRIAASQGGVAFIFSAFIGAIITGTSVVVTINQLVLSQELGAVGKQRSRMQGAIDFRADVEAETETGVSQPEPAAFLSELVDSIQTRADNLNTAVSDGHDDELTSQVEAYVERLTDNAETVKADLDNAQFGTFGVIWAALNFNYSWKIYEARTLREQHSDSLSTEATTALDEMIELLKFFGPAREHFKTLYFQWELINLSRALLYISVPALLTMGLLSFYVDANTLYGSFFGTDILIWVVSVGFVVGVAPFVVFTVFVLRIATVAKRTLAMGPFILRETNRERSFE